jgi:Putative DNA-binding domain
MSGYVSPESVSARRFRAVLGDKSPGPSVGDRIQWNHRVHEVWAGEQLYFWRLGFFPTYDTSAIVSHLDAVFHDQHIDSYLGFELFGVYDILLRVWLPPSTSQKGFQMALYERLHEDNLQVLEVFNVWEVLRHWTWESGKEAQTRVLVPSESVMRDRLADDAVAAINDRGSKAEEFIDASKDDLVRPYDHEPGIRFVVVITSSVQTLTMNARQSLRESICEIVDSATSIFNKTLYEGFGFGQFLMMGRVSLENFEAIKRELVHPIGRAGIGEWVQARTYTHISTDDQFFLYRERIPTITVPDEIDYGGEIEELLAGEESGFLEIKGSAFTELGAWLHGAGDPRESRNLVNEGVLRTIVGMLNAEGGTVLIGALEAGRYANADTSIVESLPAHGEYLLVGIEIEYDERGWDRYQLRLRQLINERITPSPGPLVEIARTSFQGRDFCIIRVRPSATAWTYLKVDKDAPARFYVRQGNSTPEVTGPDADRYKELKRRDIASPAPRLTRLL